MGYHMKIQWAVKPSKTHKQFEVLFQDGRNRPFITIKDNNAVKHLTTVGFEGVKLEAPLINEEFTKIILFDYPTYLEPDDVLDTEMFAWIKRREVKVKGRMKLRPQLVGLFKGADPPESVFI